MTHVGRQWHLHLLVGSELGNLVEYFLSFLTLDITVRLLAEFVFVIKSLFPCLSRRVDLGVMILKI